MFMKKPVISSLSVEESVDDSSMEELMNKVRNRLFDDKSFQDNWFEKAPGSGSNESERDFFLISYIIQNITRDREKVRLLIEKSPFYKSKDKKHLEKWNSRDHRYYNYQFDQALKRGIKEE